MWLVVGLGNPGTRYRDTRHNLGFMVVEALATRAGASWSPDAHCECARAVLHEHDVCLAKPATYVNRSGLAVRALLERFDLGPADLLVVVDDIHLPFGRLRLRPSGSAGGHNGLRSIETTLQSSAYARLRIGVGAPDGAAEWAEHVLGGFDRAESEALPGVIEAGADAVLRVLRDGVEKARPQVNAAPGSASARRDAAASPHDDSLADGEVPPDEDASAP